MMSTDNIILWLRLTFSMAFAVSNGIDLSFNVYAVPLKETLNFTQTQVEIVASMNDIGIGLAFIETFMTGVFGYITTFVVTWVTFPLSCGLFSFVLAQPEVFHDWPMFVNLIQLLLAASNTIGFMVVSRACLEIVPDRFTGTLMAMFGTAACFGKIFYAGLLDQFFPGDLSGFFLCLTVIFAAVLGTSYVTLYPVARQMEQKQQDNSGDGAKGDGNDMSLSEVLRSPSFHMTFWSSTVFSSVGYTLLNNITSVTDALGKLDAFQIVTIMSVCIMITRLLYGIIFDKVSSQACGFALLFTGYVSVTVGLFLGMYFLNNTTIYLITVLFGMGVGTAFFVPLAILVVQFGRMYYNFVAAALCATCAVTMALFQITTGLLYDTRIVQLGLEDNFCYGSDCFFWSFFLLLSFTVLVIVVQSANFVITVLMKSKRYEKYKPIDE